MDNETRIAFEAYQARQAELNGVTSSTVQFAVAPSVEQKLEEKIRESADFLNQVNIVPVKQQKGEKLGMDLTGPVAGRTNTKEKDREPRDLLGIDEQGYEVVKTNFDTYVRYNTLDMWAKFPDFQTRLRNKVTQQIARDRLMIGFNGVNPAANTDVIANPLLQDVNTGWLQHIRNQAPARVMTGMKVDPDTAGADYVSLDAMVFDGMNNLLDEWYRQATDLVIIVGGGLVTEKYLGLINSAKAPTEINALETLMLTRTIGGRKAIMVPFFPARSLLVTSLSNLSIYWQEGTRRRQIVDNPKRDQIEDYQSVNECYVVEDYGKACLFDDIKLAGDA